MSGSEAERGRKLNLEGYESENDIVEDFVDACRGLTRPLVTLTLVGVLCAVIIRLVWSTRIPSLPAEVWIALISSFTTGVAVVIAFWFASRNTRASGP